MCFTLLFKLLWVFFYFYTVVTLYCDLFYFFFNLLPSGKQTRFHCTLDAMETFYCYCRGHLWLELTTKCNTWYAYIYLIISKTLITICPFGSWDILKTELIPTGDANNLKEDQIQYVNKYIEGKVQLNFFLISVERTELIMFVSTNSIWLWHKSWLHWLQNISVQTIWKLCTCRWPMDTDFQIFFNKDLSCTCFFFIHIKTQLHTKY